MTCVYTLLLVFIYFNGIIFNLLPQLSFLSVWDEIITVILFFACLAKLFGRKRGRIKLDNDFKFLVPWLIVVVIGLVGNAMWQYAGAGQAIIRDIVGFLKFPICFFALRYLKLDERLSNVFCKSFLKIVHILICIMMLCAVASLFLDIGMSQSEELRHGIHSFQFLFNHPNSFGLIMVMILSVLDAIDDNVSQKKYLIFCLFLLVLTMRTKIIAFCAVYIFVKFGAKWAKKFKLLFILGSVVLVFSVAYSKLAVVITWSEAARMRFWTESINLLKDCFPIGTGFGTFASHISGRYRSTLYSVLNIKEIFDQNGNPTSVLGDTGYPYYIAQFGLLGLLLIAISISKLIKIIGKDFKKGRPAYVMLAYLAIALTGESTLLNVGFEIAVTMSILLALKKSEYSMVRKR